MLVYDFNLILTSQNVINLPKHCKLHNMILKSNYFKRSYKKN